MAPGWLLLSYYHEVNSTQSNVQQIRSGINSPVQPQAAKGGEGNTHLLIPLRGDTEIVSEMQS